MDPHIQQLLADSLGLILNQTSETLIVAGVSYPAFRQSDTSDQFAFGIDGGGYVDDTTILAGVRKADLLNAPAKESQVSFAGQVYRVARISESIAYWMLALEPVTKPR